HGARPRGHRPPPRPPARARSRSGCARAAAADGVRARERWGQSDASWPARTVAQERALVDHAQRHAVLDPGHGFEQRHRGAFAANGDTAVAAKRDQPAIAAELETKHGFAAARPERECPPVAGVPDPAVAVLLVGDDEALVG